MVERYFPEKPHYFLFDKKEQPWIDAFIAVDEHGDKRPLINLLKKNTPMPWPVPFHFAHLLDRLDLTRQQKRGQKKATTYVEPPQLRKLVRAKKYYQHFISNGDSRDDAITKAAKRSGASEATLHTYMAGKHAFARRYEKRRVPPNPRS